MQKKIIRFRSEFPSTAGVLLTADWVVRCLSNPIWLATEYLLAEGQTFDEAKLYRISVGVLVFPRKEREKMISYRLTLKNYLFSHHAEPAPISSSMRFTSTWYADKGIDVVHILARDGKGESSEFYTEREDRVKAGLRAFAAFARGWQLAQDDKLILTLEAGKKAEVIADDAKLSKAIFDLYEPYETGGWHPSDSGIGPEGLTDDERDVYYDL